MSQPARHLFCAAARVLAMAGLVYVLVGDHDEGGIEASVAPTLHAVGSLDRRTALRRVAGAAVFPVLVSRVPTTAVLADTKEIPPGYVPRGTLAKEVGQKITTPNGLIYEALELGTKSEGPRDGPPSSGSTVELRFTGHINSFDGPVFDSSALRGMRKPLKEDFLEVRLNLDPTLTNGLFEAMKLMKVGGKGRFIQPPNLSYREGKSKLVGDEDSPVKEVPANSTLYYEVELIRIIKP